MVRREFPSDMLNESQLNSFDLFPVAQNLHDLDMGSYAGGVRDYFRGNPRVVDGKEPNNYCKR